MIIWSFFSLSFLYVVNTFLCVYGERVRCSLKCVDYETPDHVYLEETKSETMLTASVLNQDPSTEKVKNKTNKNADFNRTAQNMCTYPGHPPFSKQRTNR